MIKIEDYGFYEIDANYLEYLYSKDSEVYYNNNYKKTIKPFVGIVIVVNEINYFVPLTSAKEKHKKWKNVANNHFLIYEIVKNDMLREGDVYKDYSDDEKIHVLSVLDIKKMIPVPDGFYRKINFNNLTRGYATLMRKEYRFCLTIKEKLEKRVDKIYKRQIEKGLVDLACCDFVKLEKVMTEWLNEDK